MMDDLPLNIDIVYPLSYQKKLQDLYHHHSHQVSEYSMN